MAEAKKYSGGCHCGKVRYEVTAVLDPVMSCNCSICSKKAHLLAFVPESAFTLLQGADEVSDYQFNKHNIHHLFCRTCGIQSFATGSKDGKVMYAVNARCLDGVDPATLNLKYVDGKSF